LFTKQNTRKKLSLETEVIEILTMYKSSYDGIASYIDLYT